MLVTFVGSPCSGKTTCAALIFSALKDAGVQAEFISEQARLYIAERRAVSTQEPMTLTDIDQILIMKKQLDIESLLLDSCRRPDVVLVSDSSPMNSLLYMSTAARQELSVRNAVQKHLQHLPLTFYVNTVSPGFGVDPNRIHDMEASRRIDLEVLDVVNKEGMIPIHLVGDSRHRTDMALSYILTQLLHPR